MTYARNVKEELCSITDNYTNFKLSMLEALLRLNCEIQIKAGEKLIVFKSTNFSVCNFFSNLIKEFYDCQLVIIEEETKYLNKLIMYSVIIETQSLIIIEEFDLLRSNSFNKEAILNEEEAVKGYLRGAFLAKGSVNDPNSGYYHLEIVTTCDIEAIFIQRLMNFFDLNAKITKRRNDLLIYLKDIQMIKDFLRLIGTVKNVFLLEEVIINKEFEGNIKRTMNFEIANETRGLKASLEQAKYIEYLEKHFVKEKIDPKLMVVMDARNKNPNSSVNELISYIKEVYKEDISKSGINHRFRKIKELALEHQRRRSLK